jgi:hypothetical protein
MSRDAAELQQESLVSPIAAVPMAVAPTPMPATPAPVTAVPAPVTVVPVMAPTHFFGLEAVDLVAGGDGGMGIFIAGMPSARIERLRDKWRRLRARSKSGDTSNTDGQSKGELQKIPTLHDISSVA